MFIGFVGFTATAVSFCDDDRPRNPAADWFVQSWFTRTLVPLESEHPADPGPGTGIAPFGGCTPLGSGAVAVGSAVTTPDGATRLVRVSFWRATSPLLAPIVNGAMRASAPTTRRIRRMCVTSF